MDEFLLKMNTCFENLKSIEDKWLSEQKAALLKLDEIVNAVLSPDKTPTQEKKKHKRLETISQFEEDVSLESQENLSISRRPRRAAKEKASIMLKELNLLTKLRQGVVVKQEPLSIEDAVELKPNLSSILESSEQKTAKIVSRVKRNEKKVKKEPKSGRVLRRSSKEDISNSDINLTGSEANISESSVEIVSNESSVVVISEESDVEPIQEEDTNRESKKKKSVTEVVSTRITRSKIKKEKIAADAQVSIGSSKSVENSKKSNQNLGRSSTETSFVSVADSSSNSDACVTEDKGKNYQDDGLSQVPEEPGDANDNENKQGNTTIYEDVIPGNSKEDLVVLNDKDHTSSGGNVSNKVELNSLEIGHNGTLMTGDTQEGPGSATFVVGPSESTFVVSKPGENERSENKINVISDIKFDSKESNATNKEESIPKESQSDDTSELVLKNKQQGTGKTAGKKNVTPVLKGVKSSKLVTKQSSKENQGSLKLQQKKLGTPKTRERLLDNYTPEIQPKKKIQHGSVPLNKPSNKYHGSPKVLKILPGKNVPVVRSNSVKGVSSNYLKSNLQQPGKNKQQMSNFKDKQSKILKNKVPAEEVRKQEDMEIRQQEDYLRRLEQKRVEIELKEKQRQQRQLISQNSKNVPPEFSCPVDVIEQEIQNVYNFGMLESGDSTDDELKPKMKRPAIPIWSRSQIRNFQIDRQNYLPTKVIDWFFSVKPLNPDLSAIFPGIHPDYLKRNSSVVWNTPPRYSQMPKY